MPVISPGIWYSSFRRYLIQSQIATPTGAFPSRKVVRAVAAIERGSDEKLRLGELNTRVDWGYSPEYTDAMQRILGLSNGTDFVIASGRAVAVSDFVASAFSLANLDWRDHVIIEPSLIRKVNRGPLVGDPRKLFEATGWKAGATIEHLAQIMLAAERKHADHHLADDNSANRLLQTKRT